MAGQSWAIRLSSALLGGYEPAPAEFIARQSYYPWLVVGTTCIAAFIGQLDASIVELTLPTLEHEFLARLSAVSWVTIAYQLAFVSVLPVFARLAEIAGRKQMYLIGFALFALASVLCGLASDLTQLIAFRVLLGIAGAMPQQYRHSGQGGRSQQAGTCHWDPCRGPGSWRQYGSRYRRCVAGRIGWLVIPQTTDLDSDRRFDWWGAILLMPALASLLVLISESYAWGATSPAIIGTAVAAAVLLAVFIRRERRAPAPLVDLDLFRIICISRDSI